MAWGVHGRGARGGWCVAGGMHGLHAPRQILRDTVNERAVRILLECILVFIKSATGEQTFQTNITLCVAK